MDGAAGGGPGGGGPRMEASAARRGEGRAGDAAAQAAEARGERAAALQAAGSQSGYLRLVAADPSPPLWAPWRPPEQELPLVTRLQAAQQRLAFAAGLLPRGAGPGSAFEALAHDLVTLVGEGVNGEVRI